MDNYDIVDYNLAPKGHRFANYLIDLTVHLIFLFVLILILDILVEIFEFIKVNFILSNDGGLDRLLSMLIYALFMFATEVLLKGRSIGKLITGTKVVTEDGGIPTTTEYLKRSFIRIIPFEAFSLLGSRNIAWHDKWSNTRVVNAKGFDTAIKTRDEIEEIGHN